MYFKLAFIVTLLSISDCNGSKQGFFHALRGNKEEELVSEKTTNKSHLQLILKAAKAAHRKTQISVEVNCDPTPPPTPQPTFTRPPSRGPTIMPTTTRTWVQQGSDLTGTSEDEMFGTSIALSQDGRLLAVGGSGAFRMYVYGTNGWSFPVELSSVVTNLVSSISMTSDGNNIVIGEVESGISGKVLVFERDTSTNVWGQRGSTISEGLSGDLFGWAVAITEAADKVVIGAPGSSTPYIRVGTLVNGNWLSARIENSVAGYGTSITLLSDGNTAAVGATDGNGSVFIQDIASLLSTSTQVLEGDGDGFGAVSSFSLDGTTLAVGTASGNYVKVYTNQTSSGDWEQLGSTIVGEVDSSFGQTLQLSDNGHKLIVGAKTQSTSGSNLGQAILYGLSSGEARTSASFETQWNGDFAKSVSISGNGKSIAVAGPLIDNGSNPDAGLVRVFQIETDR